MSQCGSTHDRLRSVVTCTIIFPDAPGIRLADPQMFTRSVYMRTHHFDASKSQTHGSTQIIYAHRVTYVDPTLDHLPAIRDILCRAATDTEWDCSAAAVMDEPPLVSTRHCFHGQGSRSCKIPLRSLATSNFFPTPWVTEQSRCLSGKSSLKRRQRQPGVQAITCGLLVSGSDG
ncbi:hypothetical protein AVEN_519-1 [Araneus ventricosus]|uniref:Uncharacterized protein n=1 Tax=Araneus ventricosus TaxID=182803 RepID=A0A4Y2W651_ARAVE|nr:hypothetical protein AVEN_519-1 [Araneus ventricosus]